ncbi:hypothetical protein YC2023_081781 [Brassica napus]
MAITGGVSFGFGILDEYIANEKVKRKIKKSVGAYILLASYKQCCKYRIVYEDISCFNPNLNISSKCHHIKYRETMTISYPFRRLALANVGSNLMAFFSAKVFAHGKQQLRNSDEPL